MTGWRCVVATTLGTPTRKDTVNAALSRVVDETRARRERALEDLQAVADSGGFDFDRIAELDE